MKPQIPPGSTIGIMGGGQLGRMLAMAAAELGYHCHIYCPEKDSPAFEVAQYKTVASYTNRDALAKFAASVDVITFEFENIPHDCLKILAKETLVRPSSFLLETSQNRLREKNFVRKLGIGTAPFAPVRSLKGLKAAIEEIGLPAILKTAELGYDGKGQVTIREASKVGEAWKKLKTKEAVLEGFVDFEMEISVIVARDPLGNSACYSPVQNFHANHILDRTIAPAPISEKLAKKATDMAHDIAAAAGLIGLLAVEMFVTKDGVVLVNELAPRPHNSGHWTLDAAATSQFEQQIRAICGLPLGSPQVLCKAEMKNLIGDEVEAWADYASDPNIKIHLYGKKEVRPGRKMGHLTLLRI